MRCFKCERQAIREKTGAQHAGADLWNITAKLSLQKVFSLSFIFQFIVVTRHYSGHSFYGGQQAVNALLKEMQQEIYGKGLRTTESAH